MATTQAKPAAQSCCTPLLDADLCESDAHLLAATLKALADPVRLRLLSILYKAPDGEVCACDLPEILNKSQPTVSHHLTQLVKAGILSREQRGKWAHFKINRHQMASICRAFGGPPCC